MNTVQQDVSAETEQFNAEASALLIESRSIAVTDAESAQGATTFLLDIKTKLKTIETARTKLVKPLNDHVKFINDEFKKTKIPLEEAERVVKMALSKYQQEQLRIQQEAERKAREQAEKERQEAMEKAREEGKSEIVAAAKVQEEEVKKVETTIRSEGAKATFRTVWKFEVIDPSKVPTEYLVVDEKKIGVDVRAGKREIPGVKIFSEQVVAV